MSIQPRRRIRRVTIIDMRWEMRDTSWEKGVGFDFGYRAGSSISIGDQIIRIETDDGVVGAAPGPGDERSARYLIGRDPMTARAHVARLEAVHGRYDRHSTRWHRLRALGLAGHCYGVPVHELLGGAWRLQAAQLREHLSRR